METTEKKPRGKRGQGCLYRVKNSRNWYIKFSVDGQTFQETANTESKREATDFLKARILACSNGDAVPNSNRVTVKELYDALLADYRINGKSLWWATGQSTGNCPCSKEVLCSAMKASRAGLPVLCAFIG